MLVKRGDSTPILHKLDVRKPKKIFYNENGDIVNIETKDGDKEPTIKELVNKNDDKQID